MEIIFEDKDILVINKPAGLVVTSEGVKKEVTLEDYLRDKYLENAKLPRAGIVHRLDKGTSGVMVIAKNNRALDELKRQFKQRLTKKRYWAFIGGEVVTDGEIKVPIKRSKYQFGRWGVNPEGKEAWTIFKLLKKYKRQGRFYSLVEIDLKTGRTHQIRVHFSYLRWPLLGDRLYGGETNEWIDHPFLHAKELTFLHPSSGEKVCFESDLPDELEKVLAQYEEI